MATGSLAKFSGKRQVSLHVPFDDWKLLDLAAAVKRVPVTTLILQLLEPGLKRLRANPPTRDDGDDG